MFHDEIPYRLLVTTNLCFYALVFLTTVAKQTNILRIRDIENMMKYLNYCVVFSIFLFLRESLLTKSARPTHCLSFFSLHSTISQKFDVPPLSSIVYTMITKTSLGKIPFSLLLGWKLIDLR